MSRKLSQKMSEKFMQSYYFQLKAHHIYLTHFWGPQKNVFLKLTVYRFSRMVVHLFQGLFYQKDSFAQ